MSKINFNERTTENIIRQHFQQDPLFNIIKFEEQKTSNSVIKNCLSKASKNKTNKPGFPEFIITAPAYPNDVIIVECKANEKYHESKTKDKINDYAVDGIMHYAKFLKKEFNVWCIAASGQNKETLKISNFYLEKKSNNFSKEDNQLLNQMKREIELYLYNNKHEPINNRKKNKNKLIKESQELSSID